MIVRVTRAVGFGLTGMVIVSGCSDLNSTLSQLPHIPGMQPQAPQSTPQQMAGTAAPMADDKVTAAVNRYIRSKDHRSRPNAFRSMTEAIVSGAIGSQFRQVPTKPASPQQRTVATQTATSARANLDAQSRAQMQQHDIKQAVPVAHDEVQKTTSYVFVDSTGLAGEQTYVLTDAQTDSMVADSTNNKLSSIDGQQVVLTNLPTE